MGLLIEASDGVASATKFFEWGDPALPAFIAGFAQVHYGMGDLVGQEVEIISDAITPTNGQRKWPLSQGERELKEFRKGMSSVSGRRLYGCRALQDARSVIENLEIDPARRNELVNLCNVLLRMIMLENDGHISTILFEVFE